MGKKVRLSGLDYARYVASNINQDPLSRKYQGSNRRLSSRERIDAAKEHYAATKNYKRLAEISEYEKELELMEAQEKRLEKAQAVKNFKEKEAVRNNAGIEAEVLFEQYSSGKIDEITFDTKFNKLKDINNKYKQEEKALKSDRGFFNTAYHNNPFSDYKLKNDKSGFWGKARNFSANAFMGGTLGSVSLIGRGLTALGFNLIDKENKYEEELRDKTKNGVEYYKNQLKNKLTEIEAEKLLINEGYKGVSQEELNNHYLRKNSDVKMGVLSPKVSELEQRNSAAMSAERRYKRLLEDTEKYERGELNNVSELFTGTLDTINPVDYVLNLDNNMNSLFNNESSKKYLESLAIEDEIRQKSGIYDNAFYKKTGEGLGHSLTFIGEMLATTSTGGGSLAGTLGKRAVEGGVRTAVRNLSASQLDNIGLNIVKGTTGELVKDVAIHSAKRGADLYGRSFLMSNTYNQAVDKRLEHNSTVIKDENNDLKVLLGEVNKRDYIQNTMLTIENLKNKRNLIQENQSLTPGEKSKKLSEIDSQLTSLENNITNIGEVDEDWGVARSLLYGSTETVKEMLAERYVGRVGDKALGGINKTLSISKKLQTLRRVGADRSKLGNAVAKTLGVAEKIAKTPTLAANKLDNLIGKGKIGSIASQAIGRGMFKNRMIHSVPSEVLEEVAVQALPNPFGEDGDWGKNLKELVNPEFYRDVVIQTLLLNGGMKAAGAISNAKHTYNILTDEKYRDAYEKRQDLNKLFEEMYENIENSDLPNKESIAMLAGHGLYNVQDWYSTIIDFESQGDMRSAQTYSRAFLQNLLYNSAMSGTRDNMREVFRRMANEDSSLPQSIKDEVKNVWDSRNIFDNASRKYSGKANFGELLELEVQKDAVNKAIELAERTSNDLKNSANEQFDSLDPEEKAKFDIDINRTEFDNPLEKANHTKKLMALSREYKGTDLGDYIDSILLSQVHRKYLNTINTELTKKSSDKYQDKLKDKYIHDTIDAAKTLDDIDEIEEQYKNKLTKNQKRLIEEKRNKIKDKEIESQIITDPEVPQPENPTTDPVVDPVEEEIEETNPEPPVEDTNIDDVVEFDDDLIEQYNNFDFDSVNANRNDAPFDDAAFAPLPLRHNNINPDTLEATKRILLNLERTKGSKPTFEDFLRGQYSVLGFDEADKFSRVYKKYYEAATNTKISEEDFNNIWRNVFIDHKSLSQIDEVETEFTPVSDTNTQIQNKTTVTQVNPVTGVTTPIQNKNPEVTTLYAHKAGFIAVPFTEIAIENEDGSVRYEKRTSAEHLVDVDKNKIVLDPDELNTGTELEVRPIDSSEYDKVYVQDWIREEPNDLNSEIKERGEKITFKQWLDKYNVEEGSPEFIAKIPLHAYTNDGHFAFEVKDVEWYNDVTTEGTINTTKRRNISQARLATNEMRQEIYNGNNKITITRKSFGSMQETLDGRKQSLSEMNAQTDLVIGINSSTMYKNNEKVSVDNEKVVNNNLEPGKIYTLVPVNQNETVAVELITNSFRDGENLDEDITTNLEMVTKASIVLNIHKLISKPNITEEKKEEYQKILDYLAQQENMTVDKANAIKKELQPYLQGLDIDIENDLSSYYKLFLNITDNYADGKNRVNRTDGVSQVGDMIIVANTNKNTGVQQIYLHTKTGKEYKDLNGLTLTNPNLLGVQILLSNFKAKGDKVAPIRNSMLKIDRKALSQNNPMHKISRDGSVTKSHDNYTDFAKNHLKTNALLYNIQDKNGETKTIVDSHPIIQFELTNKNKTAAESTGAKIAQNSKQNKIETPATPPKIQPPVTTETKEITLQEQLDEILKDKEGAELFKGFKDFNPESKDLAFAPIELTQEESDGLDNPIYETIEGLNMFQQSEIANSLFGTIFNNYTKQVETSRLEDVNEEKLSEEVRKTFDKEIDSLIEKENKRLEYLKGRGIIDGPLVDSLNRKLGLFNSIKEQKEKFISPSSKLVKKIKNLTQSNIDLNEKEVENISEENRNEDNDEDLQNALEQIDDTENTWAISSLQKSPVNSFSSRLKVHFSGIVRLNPVTGEVETNFLEQPEYYDVNEVFQYLVGQMIDMPSDWQILMDRLAAKQEHPILGQIYEKLQNVSKRTQNEILNRLVLTKLQMYTVKVANNQLRVLQENYNSGTSKLRREWINNFENSKTKFLRVVDDEYHYDPKTIEDFVNRFNSYVERVKANNTNRNKYFDPENPEYNNRIKELKSYLDELGLDLSLLGIKNLVDKNGIGVLEGNTGYISGIVHNLTLFAQMGKYESRAFFGSVSNYLDLLLSEEVDAIGLKMGLGFRVAGKNIQESILPTLLRSLMMKLKDPESEYFKRLLKNPYTEDATILDILQNDPDFAKVFSIDYESLKALSTEAEGKSNNTKLNEIGDEDKTLNKLGFFQHTVKKLAYNKDGIPFRVARMVNMTVSDKDNMPLHTTAVMDLSYTDNEYNTTIVETHEGLGLSDKVLDLLFEETFMSEFKRILHAYKKDTNIMNYNDAAKRFLSLPGFNFITDSKGNNIHDIIRIIVQKKGADIENFKDILDDLKFEAKIVIDNYVNSEAKKINSSLRSAGVKEEKISDLSSIDFIDSSFLNRKAPGKDFDTQLEVVALDIAANTLFHNNNQSKILQGDMALYAPSIEKFVPSNYLANATNPFERQRLINEYFKNNPQVFGKYIGSIGESILKRRAMDIAPGNLLSNSRGDKYIQIFVNDVQKASSNIAFYVQCLYGKNNATINRHSDNIKNAYNEIDRINETVDPNSPEYETLIDKQLDIIEKSKKWFKDKYPKISDFLKIDGTDAQEYTTWKEHLDIMMRQGRLSDEKKELLESAYKKLSNGEEVSPEELDVIFQPIKPVYTGPTGSLEQNGINEEPGINRIVYVKSSSFPLLPQLTKNSPLDKVRQHMETIQENTGKNVRMSYQTANKIGAINTSLTMNDLYTKSSEELLGDNFDGVLGKSILEMDRENFKIQQDVPYKTDKYLKKNSEDYISMSTQMWKILMSNGVNRISEKVFETKDFDRYLLHQFNKFITKQEGFTHIEPIVPGEKINGYQIDALKFWIESRKIEREANKLRKDLFLHKKNRALSLKKLVKIIKEELDTRDYPQSLRDSLELTTNSQGEAEFIIPLWLNENFEKIDNLIQSIVTKRILKQNLPGNGLISTSSEGFKKLTINDLSTKDKQSIIWLDPNRTGDLQATRYENGKLKEAEVLIQPKFRQAVLNEKTGKYETKIIDLREKKEDGSYRYLKTVNGNLVLNTDMIDESVLQQFSFRIPVSSHQSGAIIKVAGFLPPASADMIVLPKEHTTLLGEDYDIDKRYVYKSNYVVHPYGKISLLHGNNRQVKIDELTKLYPDLTEDKIESKVNDLIEENLITGIYKSVYSTDDLTVQSKINKILSMDVAKNTAKFIKDRTSKEERDTDNMNYSIYSDFYQTEQMNSGTAGKLGTALHSLAVVFQAQTERVGPVRIGDPINICGIQSDGLIGLTNCLVARQDSGKYQPRQVSDVHAENQNSAVDNIKAQIMFARNENEYTMNFLIAMTNRGFDQIMYNDELIHLPSIILSQPIMKRYVELKTKQKSSVSLDKVSESQIIDQLIEEFLVGVDDQFVEYFRRGGDPNQTMFENSQKAFGSLENTSIETLVDNLSGNSSNISQLQVLALFLQMEQESNFSASIKRLANKNSLPKSSIEVDSLYRDLISIYRNLGIVHDLSKNIDNHVINILVNTNSEEIGRFVNLDRRDREEYLNSLSIEELFNPSTVEGVAIKNALSISKEMSNILYGNLLQELDSIYNEYLKYNNISEDSLSKKEREKLKSKLLSEYKDFILSSSATGLFTGTVEQERQRLFFDTPTNESLASYMKRLKQHPIFHKLFERSDFLKPFIFDGITNIPGIPSILKYSQDFSNKQSVDLAYEDFLVLASEDTMELPEFNGVSMTPRKLMQELASYAMLSKQEGGSIGFRHLINNKFLSVIGFNKLHKINHDPKRNLKFIQQFLKQNPNYIKNGHLSFDIEKNPDLKELYEKKDEESKKAFRAKVAKLDSVYLDQFIKYNIINLGTTKQPILFVRSKDNSTRYDRVNNNLQFGYHEYDSSGQNTYLDYLDTTIEMVNYDIEEVKEKMSENPDMSSNKLNFLTQRLNELVAKRKTYTGEEQVEPKETKKVGPAYSKWDGKTAKEILQEIASKEGPLKDIAVKMLEQDLSGIKIVLQDRVSTRNNPNQEYKGVFNIQTNTIYLSPEYFSTQERLDREGDGVVIEEFIHASTILEMRRYLNDTKSDKPSLKEGVEVPKHIKEILALYEMAKDKLGDNPNLDFNSKYYLKNIEEFVAGVFVDSNFSQLLDNQEYESNKSLLQKFKEIVASLIRRISSDSTFSREVRDNVIKLINNKLDRNKETKPANNINKPKNLVRPNITDGRYKIDPNLSENQNKMMIEALDNKDKPLLDEQSRIVGNDLSIFFEGLEKQFGSNFSEYSQENKDKIIEIFDDLVKMFGNKAMIVRPVSSNNPNTKVRNLNGLEHNFIRYITKNFDLLNKDSEYKVFQSNSTYDGRQLVLIDKNPDYKSSQQIMIDELIDLVTNIENFSLLSNEKIVSLLEEKGALIKEC